VQPQSNALRARVFNILYLAAITVAMLGWVWILIRGLALAVD
jgi:hypothetical protein